MRTDALFYELFQTAPQTFFELLQITPVCTYRFESITVKASEKRIDGVIEPSDEQQPVYFLEVQAFPDDTIYWRTLREVATYFEQRPARNDNWQAVVSFTILNKKQWQQQQSTMYLFGVMELQHRVTNFSFVQYLMI